MLGKAPALNPDFLLGFFGKLNKETTLECLNDLLAGNMRQNLQLVVQVCACLWCIMPWHTHTHMLYTHTHGSPQQPPSTNNQVATKYSEQLGAEALIKLFEKFKSFEGLYYYLSAIVNTSQEPLVHFKYIEAAAKLGQLKVRAWRVVVGVSMFVCKYPRRRDRLVDSLNNKTDEPQEVERVCRDSTVYNPQEVKAFLMDAKLADPKPLIYVCDRHGFIEEMTGYLYTNNLKKVRAPRWPSHPDGPMDDGSPNRLRQPPTQPKQYIEVYVQRVSPPKTPQVVGKLLDLDCNEDFVRMLLQTVGAACPVEELVEQVR